MDMGDYEDRMILKRTDFNQLVILSDCTSQVLSVILLGIEFMFSGVNLWYVCSTKL